MSGRSDPAGKPERRVLFSIDMRYTHRLIQELRLHQLADSRRSGGYFSKVIALHPLADAVHPEMKSSEIRRHGRAQVIVDGLAFGCGLPRWLKPVDFVVSQTRLLFRMRRLLRREKKAVIFTNDAVYSGLLGLALKYMTGHPLAVAVWGNWDAAYEATGALAMPRLLPSKRLQDFVTRRVLKRADLAVAANRDNLNYMLSKGARPARSTIFPLWKYMNPAHLTEPRSRLGNVSAITRLGLDPGQLYVSYIGRLIADKLPEDALKAMLLILREAPTVQGVFAGDGPQRSALEGMAQAAGFGDRILFLGNIDQQELSYLNPLTITLAPLTGLALMESALGGAPAVAYDRDWHSEFIIPGETGFIVPFRDHEAMAARTLDIIRDPPLRERMSSNIRAHAHSLADPERIYAGEREAFEALFTTRIVKTAR